MASAVATSSPAAMSYGWLGPRLSFGRDSASPAASSSAAADHGLVSACKAEQAAAVSKEFIDFEFSFGGSGTMLPADELFADGKLLPLRPQPVAEAAPEAEREPQSAPAAAEIPATPELVRTLRPSMPEAFDPYVFSPKAPTCSSRWRELLRLRKVQTPQKPPASPSTSPSPSQVPATPSRASNSSAARSLKLLLLQRSGGRASDLSAAPLLRDSSDSETSLSLASSRFSMSSSSSSSAHDHDDFPRHSVDSVDLAPKPRIRLVRSQPQQRHCHPPASAPPRASHSSSAPPRATHSPARRRPATPPPPSVASVDSPRMNSSGKIVFQGLERSSSSPAGSAHSSLRSRSRVMDRSYSTPVVLNVPVCSRPSFGFFKDKKDVAAKDAAAARLRSSLGRKTAHPAGNSRVSCRDLVSSK
ncbi:serine/arginine repetitive matrix protein 1-like [Lolium rigidum]|uniref:serine/arginine repetitive matrix protein 1-like n=1 Tax=Lolium rigidum TaxID=89674 RepID=UPI001F5CB852|nr:serine/arginine repetitive matrix protein 1-like [Lolium rigidum]